MDPHPARAPLTLQQRIADAACMHSAPRRSDLRCGARADVQLVCGAGRYEMDVLLRVSETSDELGVVGQVTRADSLHEPVPHLALVAYDCDSLRPVAEADTDAFGGFDMKLDQGGRYALAMGASSAAPCILLWEGGPQ